ALERQAPVASTSAIQTNTGWLPFLSPVFGPEASAAAMPSDYPNVQNGGFDADVKTVIFGNFGGCFNIALSGNDRPTLLMLEYGTKTGGGMGLAFPL
ncbi:MAG: hypothetical protein ACHQNE_05750, partial [Candidatus Kapaibacterium sp.]